MVKIPRPGTPVRGSRSGKPIMVLFDLLGRRWAMGVLWTLAKDGPLTFRDIQAACDSISPTVLNTRLKDLREAGLVEHGDGGYRATALGVELFEMLRPLGNWADDWAEGLPEEAAG